VNVALNSYQYPPELFELLVDVLPKLVKSKQGVLDWLRGAGVPDALLADLRQELSTSPSTFRKATAARVVLRRINEGGDRYLAARREVLKRVTETDDFSASWESDRLAAQGLVARVRDVVNVKDTFTRINQERETEARRHRASQAEKQAEVAAKRIALNEVQRDLAKQFSATDPWKRGKALEGILNRYFDVEDILVREAFEVHGDEGEGIVEQIDGVIELDSHLYLVEMKWWSEKISPKEVGYHMVKVGHRGAMRGVFISASEYTPAAIKLCQENLQQRLIVLSEVRELVFLLERQLSLKDLLREKVRAAAIHKKPLHILIS
jgi:restriction system protein